jgi:serine/threonine protein kinase
MSDICADRRALKSIGPFELIAKIGQGGNATVFKARHQPTNKVVAIKVIPRLLEQQPGEFERFEREFTVIRELRHPNIVRSIGFGKESEILYLILEFVPGQNLEMRLKHQGCLSLDETKTTFIQIAEALRFLHANSILHRDIKPSNIFLTPGNDAKLGDFGLLKKLTEDSHITRTRQGMGTIEYGAPEQFDDAKRVDRTCDIFSLAATIYTALTGQFPFGIGGHLQILQRKLLHQFVPIRLLLPAIPAAIDQLVSRCLNPDPRRRPSDCNEFLDVLNSLPVCPDRPTDTGGVGASAVPRSRPDRRATLRFAVDLSASFVPFHQKMRGRWEATILDISCDGVRLQTPRPIPVNSVVHISIGKQVNSLALVRWVRPSEGPMQVVGCSFVRPLVRQDIEGLAVNLEHCQAES